MKNCYVHIPFCSQICSYCAFPKMFMYEKYVLKYLDSLEDEIDSIYKGEVLDTLYIGGGTPSSLNVDDLDRLFQILSKFKLSNNYEFTFECNIENISKEKLELMKKYGVNRLSFGVQSFNKKILKFLNRNYSRKDVFNVINLAHNMGFKNINIDLIYGIPFEDMKILKNDVNLFLKLGITHISTYSLMIENNTVLGNLGYKNILEDLECEMYSYIKNKLKQYDFIHYELSNYALCGYESRHNLNYWNNNSYYGFGLGAVSYIGNYRISNTCNMRKYLQGNYEKERIYEDKKVQMSNEMILGLRKTKGISLKCFEDKYGVDVKKVYDIDMFLNNHILEEENGCLKINEEYLYVSNEILLKFI